MICNPEVSVHAPRMILPRHSFLCSLISYTYVCKVRQTFKTRALITSKLRQLLDNKGFLEIETPILHGQPGTVCNKAFVIMHRSSTA